MWAKEGQGTELYFTVMPPFTNRGESIKAVRFRSPGVLSVLVECAWHPAVYATSQYVVIGVSIQIREIWVANGKL